MGNSIDRKYSYEQANHWCIKNVSNEKVFIMATYRCTIISNCYCSMYEGNPRCEHELGKLIEKYPNLFKYCVGGSSNKMHFVACENCLIDHKEELKELFEYMPKGWMEHIKMAPQYYIPSIDLDYRCKCNNLKSCSAYYMYKYKTSNLMDIYNIYPELEEINKKESGDETEFYMCEDCIENKRFKNMFSYNGSGYSYKYMPNENVINKMLKKNIEKNNTN